MDEIVANLHDAVTANLVAGAAAILLLLASLAFVWKRPRLGRLAVAFLIGAVVTTLSTLATSTGHSGTLTRTRYGFPHFFAFRNHDAATEVDRFTILQSYMLADLAFWVALTVLIATLTSRIRRAQGASLGARR